VDKDDNGCNHSSSKGKCKVKLSLYLIKHHAMKTEGDAEIQLHAFLTLARDERKWSVSRPGRFNSVKDTPIIIG
jgi:hypothetical protein